MRKELRRRNFVESIEAVNGKQCAAQSEKNVFKTHEEKTGTRGALHNLYCIVLILFHIIIFFIAIYSHHYVPAVTTSDGDYFSERRARLHLNEITSYGYRTTGSFANENLTVNYLLKQLHSIKQYARQDLILEIDVQRPTGFFMIDFLEGFTSYYKNVTNIIVKVSSRENYPAEHSILINAHFDSSPQSPGASDDVVSCASMLEVLRVITSSHIKHHINHSLIFLFNGAEENVLQASHGFITQHPWAENIRVFVNLEAAGAGGRELVFQTGPEHPWLIKMYANSTNYPFASIIGQEFFQTGLIPGDTDFRIFRDYGNIPGIDIAYITNGYVYHTSEDVPSAITAGSIQRAGNNLLEMLKQLTQSSLVADPSHDKHGAMVFYDFLGLFLVIYPQRIGFLLNSLVAILTYLSIFMKFSKRSKRTTQRNHEEAVVYHNSTNTLCVREFIVSFLTTVLSWLLSIIIVLIIAQLITSSGHSLSWYCKPYLLVGIYVLPVIMVVSCCHYFRATLSQNKDNWSKRWNQEEHTFYAVLTFWNTILSVMTYYKLGSAFICLLLVTFPLFTRVLLWDCWLDKKTSQNTTAFIAMYLGSLFIPVLFLSYMAWMHLDFIIPILGRTGTNEPPEFIIAIFVAFLTLVITSYSTSLIYVFQKVKSLSIVLCGIWLLSFIAVLLGIIFPYSYQPWCPKRIVVQHISRTFHDINGNIESSDSGLWVVPFDYLGIKHIDHLPDFQQAYIPDIQFGDFPYYLPVSFMFETTWYIPGPKPDVKSPHSVKLVAKNKQNDEQRRLHFEVEGPCHMGLHISPKPGVDVINSSFGQLYQRYIPRKGLPPAEEYFVYYSHGIYTGPWQFWIDIKQTSSTAQSDEGFLDIGFAAHYTDQGETRTAFMDEFEKKLPNWVNIAAWPATYEKWVF